MEVVLFLLILDAEFSTVPYLNNFTNITLNILFIAHCFCMNIKPGNEYKNK